MQDMINFFYYAVYLIFNMKNIYLKLNKAQIISGTKFTNNKVKKCTLEKEKKTTTYNPKRTPFKK